MPAKVPVLRWFLHFLLPVTCLVVCFALGLSILRTDKDRTIIEKREQSQAKLLKLTFELKLQQAVSDIELLAALSTSKTGSARPPSEDLAEQYVAFSQSRKIYDQVRYISPDGAELIRVNLVAGQAQVVSHAELQGKGQRYYVQDNLALPFNQVYLSPLDLNIEHGLIEIPFKPMLRLVKSLPDGKNQVGGLVVLNFLAEGLLTLSAAGANDYSYHMLVNRDGYYLKGRTPEQEWSFMFPRQQQYRMQQSSGAAWETISATERGAIYTAEGFYVFETVRPIRPGQISSSGSAFPYAPSARQLGPEDYHWKLIAFVPAAALPDWLGDNLKGALLGALPFWVLLAVLSWFLARAIARRQLAEAELHTANRQLEKRVEQRTRELQQTHNQMEQILNAAGEGIYGTDDHGKVIFVNATACRMLGWQSEELIGRDLHDLVMHGDGHGQPVSHENCIVKRTLKTGVSCTEQDAVFRTRNKTQLDVILNCNVIRARGQIRGVVVSFRDVTLIRQAQNQMLRLGKVIELAEQGILVLKANREILFSNRTFQRDFGVDELTMAGLLPGQWHLQGGNLARLETLLGQTSQEGFGKQRQVLSNVASKDQVLEMDFSPVFGTDSDLIGWTLIYTDVTELLELEKRLAQAQKMEAIGTLAGGIVHDFNNILTAIRGYTGLACEHLNTGQDAGPALENVAISCERARLLVSQLLSFSRHQEPKSSPSCLQVGIRESLQILRATLPSTITVSEHFKTEDLWSAISSTRLSQIMLNLTMNAAHALKGRMDGHIRIELHKQTLDSEQIQALGLAAGDYAVISVSDNGSGIPEELQKNIFEPFFTTKPVSEGTGLGLAAVADIVKSSAGTVTVDSSLGKGTSFTLYLPCCDPPDTHEAPAPRSGLVPFASMGAADANILFVDDERMLVELGEQFLEALGYGVSAVNDSHKALELFAADPGHYDLLITDQTMPGLTGLALIREVRKIRSDIPVILCSGLLEPEDTGIAEQDAVICLNKPWTPDELASTIVDALAR